MEALFGCPNTPVHVVSDACCPSFQYLASLFLACLDHSFNWRSNHMPNVIQVFDFWMGFPEPLNYAAVTVRHKDRNGNTTQKQKLKALFSSFQLHGRTSMCLVGLKGIKHVGSHMVKHMKGRESPWMVYCCIGLVSGKCDKLNLS